MEVNSKAWVLSSLKYGDTSAIVRLFSQEKGFISLMWKGAYSSRNKQKHLLRPFQEVEVQFRMKNEDTLALLKKIESVNHNHFNNPSIAQNSLLLFLSEVLQSLLKNEPENPPLYQLISDELSRFYKNPNDKLWVQNLLVQLTSFLGCKPFNNYIPESVFDLDSGSFTHQNGVFSLNAQDSALWAQFLSQANTQFSTTQRLKILEILLFYFEKQIPYFRFPNSLETIKEVFYS